MKAVRPEVGLGLAAAGREEQQVDELAIAMRWYRDAREVDQHERELERAPLAAATSSGCAVAVLGQALPHRRGDRPVGDPKGLERVRVGEQLDACLHALAREPRPDAAAPRPSRAPWLGEGDLLLAQPLAIALDERREHGLQARGVLGSVASASMPSSTPSSTSRGRPSRPRRRGIHVVLTSRQRPSRLALSRDATLCPTAYSNASRYWRSATPSSQSSPSWPRRLGRGTNGWAA